MATATYVNSFGGSTGWRTELRRTDTGYTGTRHYKVDSDDETDALLAAGVPRIGDPWSPQLPLLAVRQVSRVWVGVGSSVMRADYSSPRASLFDPGGQSHTELAGGVTTATVYQGVLASGAPDGQAIEGGAPRKLGQLQVRVSAYFNPGEVTSTMLAGWLALSGWLNSNPITLPRVGFTSAIFQLQPGQALYNNFEGPREQGDRVIVTHVLDVAPNFDYVQAIVNDKDEVIGTEQRRIYGQRVFTGLW